MQNVKEPPISELVHQIVYNEVMHVLRAGTPGLTDVTRNSLAISAAMRLRHKLIPATELVTHSAKKLCGPLCGYCQRTGICQGTREPLENIEHAR
jgi:hypothetical protein